MTNCESRYTVAPGEVLRCELEHGSNRRKHVAEAYGIPWYWSTEEEDKNA